MARVERRKHEAAAEALWLRRPRVNLIFVAHADDAEMRFGGTMLHLIGRGEKVYIAVASDGRLGCTARSVTVPALVSTREAEQREAARLAGVSGVEFLGFPDGELQALKPKLKERLCGLIRRLRPQTLLSYDPTLYYFPQEANEGFHRAFGAINHPDHRAVGEVTLDATYCGSALPHCYPAQLRSGLSPWAVEEVFLAATPHPNVSVDISAYVERKKQLLKVYRSQGVEQWLAGAISSERKFRYIPCMPPAYERGFLPGVPAAKRRCDFFTPLG